MLTYFCYIFHNNVDILHIQKNYALQMLRVSEFDEHTLLSWNKVITLVTDLPYATQPLKLTCHSSALTKKFHLYQTDECLTVFDLQILNYLSFTHLQISNYEIGGEFQLQVAQDSQNYTEHEKRTCFFHHCSSVSQLFSRLLQQISCYVS